MYSSVPKQISHKYNRGILNVQKIGLPAGKVLETMRSNVGFTNEGFGDENDIVLSYG